MQSNQSPSTAVPSSKPLEVDSRREKRVHVAVPVKVFLDPTSTNFQLCCTYEISMIGARLVAVSGIEKVGQILWLQRHNKRAKYRVVWLGEPKTPQAGQVGVEVVEQSAAIWENELRMRIMQA
ncbi:MAG TPA: PilZ domain-containing protein [Candidatus Angelobacter sp.]|jgi:hypothetical protein|nr:PilZ domain-containing protein [Candidatus Angelobacter sp.]